MASARRDVVEGQVDLRDEAEGAAPLGPVRLPLQALVDRRARLREPSPSRRAPEACWRETSQPACAAAGRGASRATERTPRSAGRTIPDPARPGVDLVRSPRAMVSRSFLASLLPAAPPVAPAFGGLRERECAVGGARRLPAGCPRGGTPSTPPASGCATRARRAPPSIGCARVGQLRTVRSAPPERRRSPSGENATAQTQPEWPVRTIGSRSGGRTSQRRTVPSRLDGGEPRPLRAEPQAGDGRRRAPDELDRLAVEPAREKQDRPFGGARPRRRRRDSPRRSGACGSARSRRGAASGRSGSQTGEAAGLARADERAVLREGERDDPRPTGRWRARASSGSSPRDQTLTSPFSDDHARRSPLAR